MGRLVEMVKDVMSERRGIEAHSVVRETDNTFHILFSLTIHEPALKTES